MTKYGPTGAVVYSSYFGGNGEDGAYGIAADTAGNAYLTGYTWSSDLPTTPGAVQTSKGSTDTDAFVTKFNPTGSGLVYSTYLGCTNGTGYTTGAGIAVDNSGNVYLTGETTSPDFPTTPGAYQLAVAGVNAFVTKLNATGTGLLYSTLLGGSTIDRGYGIAVDGAGNVYITGLSQSTDLPIKNAFQPTNVSGNQAIFVAKLNPTLSGGASLLYSSYLGGSSGDLGYGIAVDGAGNAYVTGQTSSFLFPTTANAFQLKNGGNQHSPADAFVTKISAN